MVKMPCPRGNLQDLLQSLGLFQPLHSLIQIQNAATLHSVYYTSNSTPLAILVFGIYKVFRKNVGISHTGQ